MMGSLFANLTSFLMFGLLLVAAALVARSAAAIFPQLAACVMRCPISFFLACAVPFFALHAFTFPCRFREFRDLYPELIFHAFAVSGYFLVPFGLGGLIIAVRYGARIE